MAYNTFTLTKALSELKLSNDDADLFSSVQPVDLPESLLETLATGKDLALSINTEKAKAEFIIAPLLLFVKRTLKNQISIFSGVDFNVDGTRGLNGVCDFIISRAPRQHVLSAPLIAIVEAKNDNIGDGLGQCIAEMCAAQIYNQQNAATGTVPIESIYGIVTIGSAWKFLKLTGSNVTFDLTEYYIDNPQKIVGVILHIIQYG
jgi:hypothetical protein